MEFMGLAHQFANESTQTVEQNNNNNGDDNVELVDNECISTCNQVCMLLDENGGVMNYANLVRDLIADYGENLKCIDFSLKILEWENAIIYSGDDVILNYDIYLNDEDYLIQILDW